MLIIVVGERAQSAAPPKTKLGDRAWPTLKAHVGAFRRFVVPARFGSRRTSLSTGLATAGPRWPRNIAYATYISLAPPWAVDCSTSRAKLLLLCVTHGVAKYAPGSEHREHGAPQRSPRTHHQLGAKAQSSTQSHRMSAVPRKQLPRLVGGAGTMNGGFAPCQSSMAHPGEARGCRAQASGPK